MAWSWSSFSAELGRILDDEDAGNQAHSDSTRLDGLNAALRAMMAYRPLQTKSVHTNVAQITLPTDCYRIEAILEASEDGSLSPITPDEVGGLLGWYVWSGIIYLPSEADEATLYYQSYYPAIAIGASDIPVPIWARIAVLYRAAAHCLVPNQVSRARLGAFHDRQDAGPLDNSLIQSSNWLIAEFERVMAEHKHSL